MMLSVSPSDGKQVVVSGCVSDPDPASCMIGLSGVASGSVQADSNGNFSLTTLASGPGTITAQAEDGSGLLSGQTQTSFSVAPPVVYTNVCYNSDDTMTLSGQVNDPDAPDCTVALSGGVTASLKPDVYGNFSYTTGSWSGGAITAKATDVWGQVSNPTTITVAGPPPQITSLTAQAINGTQVRLMGTVCDTQPASCTVRFGGQVSGQVQADANGNFELVTYAYGLGAITAQAQDGQGLSSGQAQTALAAKAPTLTVSPAYGPNGTVTLSGQVTADDPADLMVTFSGAATGMTVTDANGHFSYTAPNGTWAAGTVSAQVRDVWGQYSTAASTTLTNAPPRITNFTGVLGPSGLWTFSGQVSDEYAPGETVRLSGLAALDGTQGYTAVTVGADGTFSYTVDVAPGDCGTVCAVATDWSGQQSSAAIWNVS